MLAGGSPLRQLEPPDGGGQAGPGTVRLPAAVKEAPQLQPGSLSRVGRLSRHLAQVGSSPEWSEVERLADSRHEVIVTLAVGGELAGGIVDTAAAALHCLALVEAQQEFLVPALAQVGQT